MTMQNSIKKLFFSSLFLMSCYSSAFSNDYLTSYRIDGIEKLQKQMDLELSSSQYWNNYLKNIDTHFGYIESYSNILACDKSQSSLSLYILDSNNTYSLQKTYSAYTGKIKGDKRREGDLKTPVGIYNIVKKLSKVDSFYGPMAFVTSYPNIYDKYQGKNGSGIWIHGLPTTQERDEFTKGCIAIKNDNIECLNRNIEIDKTILIIDENIVNKNVLKQDLSTVLAELYRWRYTWLYNDIHEYLAFYTDTFVRNDGMKLKTFKSYKTRVFAKNETKTILFKNINVIPYPDANNMYKITFMENYKSNTFSFQGNKILIVKMDNNKMKIITEK